jgi:protein gp37
MSDLFHDRVPDDFIAAVFRVMAETPHHTYQILTKRPERAATWPGPWPRHVWMGTSIEDQRVAGRLDHLRRCRAAVRFVSAEPLLGPLTLDWAGIAWAIVGGESGPDHRPMAMAWARSLRDQCVAAGVAFFLKQQSGPRPGMRPWLIEEDGTQSEWRQYPGS